MTQEKSEQNIERLELRKKKKAELLDKKRKGKQARQEAKERGREEERRAKAELKSKRRILALKELEWRTKEKEERKLKAIEEKKARKKMDLHLEEEVIKEKLSGQVQRIDIFVGFDSIDQETADLLLKSGYTSVEKLRETSVKDLIKIGLKKKTAQMILAESEEFVEWEVYDADEHPEKI